MIRLPQRLPDPQAAWVRPDGRPSDAYYQYMRELDTALRQLIDAANTTETRLDAAETSLTAIQATLDDHEARILDLETP